MLNKEIIYANNSYKINYLKIPGRYEIAYHYNYGKGTLIKVTPEGVLSAKTLEGKPTFISSIVENVIYKHYIKELNNTIETLRGKLNE